MTTGRNDPCPCGSGKKYKKCCLLKEQVISLADARIDRLARDLREKLSNYMASPAALDEVERGMAWFFPGHPYDDEDLEPEETEVALDWVAFAHRTADNGATLCAQYAARGQGLTDQERGTLHAWSASTPGFFRVQAVAGGELHLLRLPDDRSYTVRAPGTRLKPGRLISAWLLPTLSTYCFGYIVDEFSAEAIDPLTHLLRVEMEFLQRQQPGATWEDLYRTCWPRLVEALSLAADDQADVYQIGLPPGPSVRWDGQPLPDAPPQWEEVARLTQRTLAESGSPWLSDGGAGVLRLWWDAALTLRPRVVRPEGWSAGVIYLYRREVLGDESVTQAEVAGDLGVSVSTVGSRSRQLASALGVEPLDPRYIDLMSPGVRLIWQMHCIMASGCLEADPWEAEEEEPEQMWPTEAHGAMRQAEELVDSAWEATGARRTRLARQALQLWPDAADAYVILGNEAEARGDLQEARQLFAEGVRAGERALGPQFFAENVGHFYGIIESRPYMRARAGLASCLWSLGEREAAMAHYEEMLRLNPGDNQGVRYLLAACYLMIGDDDRLGLHLAQHEDEATAAMAFTRALWQYRRTGPGAKANQLLAAALDWNPHVAAYLLGQRRLPSQPPDYIDMGGEQEAVAYAFDFGEGWRQTAGALEWLRSTVR